MGILWGAITQCDEIEKGLLLFYFQIHCQLKLFLREKVLLRIPTWHKENQIKQVRIIRTPFKD